MKPWFVLTCLCQNVNNKAEYHDPVDWPHGFPVMVSDDKQKLEDLAKINSTALDKWKVVEVGIK